MKTILCPTDFSPNAGKAMDYAIMLARKTGSKLILFHSYHLPPHAPGVIRGRQQGIGDESGEKLMELKAVIMEDEANSGLEIETFSRPGMAVDAIDDAARKLGADMIVMGTQGVSSLDDILLGTITSGVIQKARVPVMAVPSNAEFREISNIMYASDLDEEEAKAIKQLVELARLFNSRIDVVHVLEDKSDLSEEQISNLGKTYSEKYGYANLHFKTVVNEDVLDGLNSFINDNPVDIVAMQTEKRNFFEKIFVPSLTRQMAQYTDVPLLAFHE
ncbi:MAG: universal stress protein [Bacteroidia bacterium]|nr:universal stress protein [Bacteroidia bacterium]